MCGFLVRHIAGQDPTVRIPAHEIRAYEAIIGDLLKVIKNNEKCEKIVKYPVAIPGILRHHMRCSNGGKAPARDANENQKGTAR